MALIVIPGAWARGLRRYSRLRIEKVTAWFSDTEFRERPGCQQDCSSVFGIGLLCASLGTDWSGVGSAYDTKRPVLNNE